jgi:UDP-N-acetylglucosamine:LPS N-acetylglucosamine transferase
MNGANRPRVLLTIAGGGFFWQSRSVALELAQHFELHYVTPEDPSAWDGRGLPEGTFHRLSRVTTQGDRSAVRRLANFVASAAGAFRIVRHVDPQAIVCVASSIAVPLCSCGRLLGKRTVFIESITRVSHPSTTGKILDRLRLCDRFYVQWPEAAGLYRGAVYRGTLL